MLISGRDIGRTEVAFISGRKQTMPKPKKKRLYTGREYHMVGIRTGANKAYVEKDQKKEANKLASRSKVEREEDMVLPPRCLQCGFIYVWSHAKDENEEAAMECGYCSVSCMDYDTTFGVE